MLHVHEETLAAEFQELFDEGLPDPVRASGHQTNFSGQVHLGFGFFRFRPLVVVGDRILLKMLK